MKIQAATNFDTVKKEEVPRFVEIFAQDVVNVVNGNVEFGTNIKSTIVSVTFSASDTDTIVGHSLGKVPTGYIPVGLSWSMIVYTGSLSATNKQITLKSSATGTASILLF